ncbi:MAG: hypothetical protein WBB07_18730, partial [Mycobacterium sp.]
MTNPPRYPAGQPDHRSGPTHAAGHYYQDAAAGGSYRPTYDWQHGRPAAGPAYDPYNAVTQTIPAVRASRR